MHPLCSFPKYAKLFSGNLKYVGVFEDVNCYTAFEENRMAMIRRPSVVRPSVHNFKDLLL